MSNLNSIKYLMFSFQLFILFMVFKCDKIPSELNKIKTKDNSESNFNCVNRIDECLLLTKFEYNSTNWDYNETIDIYYQNLECLKCSWIQFANLNINNSYVSETTLDSYFGYKFKVFYRRNSQVICDTFIYDKFVECGEYLLTINNERSSCEMKLNKSNLSFNSNNYLYIALAIIIFLIILSNLLEFLYKCYKKRRTELKVEDIELRKNTNENKKDDNSKNQQKKKRLLSLDTFRGLSLLVMIFVNYGSGGFKSLQHKPWHGVTIADYVFPWFLWIMGMSIAISTNSLVQKGEKKISVLLKIVIRFVKLFVIGILLGSIGGVRLSQLRILGVLQRIALCYLFVAIVDLIFYKKPDIKSKIDKSKLKYAKDLIWCWGQWCVAFVIIIVWFLLTYLLPVPGCPLGYMGPGGLHENGSYAKCTGGAAGYIDKLILTNDHMYNSPSCQAIYQTTEPFDPEGILGTFNSIVLVFIGLQAGKVLVFHKSHWTRVIIWLIWFLFTFVLFCFLTFFDFQNGPIPVNKNLWTLSYTIYIASTSFIIIIIFYFIIDMKQWWNGNPIIYPGMNSIVIYIGHELFISAFPVQWNVNYNHADKLFLDIWGVVLWTLVSAYLYYNNLFFNL